MMFRAATIALPHKPARPFALPRADGWRVYCGGLLVALVVFVHEAVFRNSNAHQLDFDVQILARLVICALCGLYAMANFSRCWTYLVSVPGVMSFLLCSWALLTVGEAIDPKYSAVAALALWCVALFGPAVLNELGGRRLAQVVLWTLFVYLLASWAVHFAWPDFGFDEIDDPSSTFGLTRVSGLHSYNGLGRQAALTIGVALSLGSAGGANWWALTIPIVLALVTLVGSDSRTALIASIAATTIVCVETVSRRTKFLLFGGGAFAAALAGLALFNSSNDLDLDRLMASVSRSGDSIEMYHLTGRYELWEFVWDKIEKSPIWGYGWGGSRFVLVDGHFPTHHAHNMLLNVMVNAGIFGGVIVATMLLWQLLAALVRPSVFPDMLAMLVLVGGVADQVMFNPIPDSHTLLWFAALYWRTMGASLAVNPSDPAGSWT